MGGSRDGRAVFPVRKPPRISFSGVGGEESPKTAVLGRNKLAMMTLWFLNELISEEVDDMRENTRGREEIMRRRGAKERG